MLGRRSKGVDDSTPDAPGSSGLRTPVTPDAPQVSMGVGEGQAEEGTTREGVIGGERGPFLAKGSEAKRAVVIAGVGSGSAFRG